MTFLEAIRGRFIFLLHPNERQILARLLRSYPLIPPGHQQVSRSASPADEDHQSLLDQALAEQRKQNKRNIEEFIKERGRFRKVPDGYRLSLTTTQMEWLLQVLNEIRVGSWLHLGQPADLDDLPPKDEGAQYYYWIMNLAGFFEFALLEAWSGADPTH